MDQVVKRRIEAATDEVRSCQEALAAALERRDRLVVDAIDAGETHGAVATVLGTARSNVHRILAERSARLAELAG